MTKKGLFIGAISALVLIALWFIFAHLLASPFILPAPEAVAQDMFILIKTASFRDMLASTCVRGIVAFTLSLLCSLLLGIGAGLSPSFSAVLRPWMTTIRATPVVSIILIALLWFGSSIVPIFVSVLMTIPVMTDAITQGVRSSDPKLLEMAKVYRLSKRDILVNIHLPSALPYFIGGAGASLGLTWKVVVAGEILSSPKIGIGSAMQMAKIHLETPRVFSLTITAIFLCIITELLFDFLIYVSRSRYWQAGGE